MRLRTTCGVVAIACAACLLAAPTALAIPTFQAYIDGASAGSMGGDENTWFYGGSAFNLFVVGAYGTHDLGIDAVTLVLSVPKGEMGTISITSAVDGNPGLLTTAGQSLASPVNPQTNADIDVLTDVAGIDGYATKAFLPAGTNFNSHYPFQEGVSDFLLYDLAAFANTESNLNNYNADVDGNGIEQTSASGEQKEYAVSISGFSWVHFDVYGLVTTDQGQEIRTTWSINAASHDSTSTTVPVPGSTLLGAVGLGLIGLKKRFVG